jgi:hypothetical protein
VSSIPSLKLGNRPLTGRVIVRFTIIEWFYDNAVRKSRSPLVGTFFLLGSKPWLANPRLFRFGRSGALVRHRQL